VDQDEVHGWIRGTHQTVCGLALSQSRFDRCPHVQWPDIRRDPLRRLDGTA
jgi:hypothetical protein